MIVKKESDRDVRQFSCFNAGFQGDHLKMYFYAKNVINLGIISINSSEWENFRNFAACLQIIHPCFIRKTGKAYKY